MQAVSCKLMWNRMDPVTFGSLFDPFLELESEADCNLIGQYQEIYAVHAMIIATFLNCLSHTQATTFPISAEAIKLSRWYFLISLVTGIILTSNVCTIVHFRKQWCPDCILYLFQKTELFNTAFQFFKTCGMDARLERLIIKTVTFGKCSGEEIDENIDAVINKIRALKKNRVAPKPNLM